MVYLHSRAALLYSSPLSMKVYCVILYHTVTEGTGASGSHQRCALYTVLFCLSLQTAQNTSLPVHWRQKPRVCVDYFTVPKLKLKFNFDNYTQTEV